MEEHTGQADRSIRLADFVAKFVGPAVFYLVV